MLSVKQGGTKYHFLSLWYDSTLDLTQVSRTVRRSDGTLTSTGTPGHSGPESNNNEGVLYILNILNISRTEAYHQLQYSVISRTLVVRRVLSFCRDAVDVFYCGSTLRCNQNRKRSRITKSTVLFWGSQNNLHLLLSRVGHIVQPALVTSKTAIDVELGKSVWCDGINQAYLVTRSPLELMLNFVNSFFVRLLVFLITYLFALGSISLQCVFPKGISNM